MQRNKFRRVRAQMVACALVALSGCASNPPLYQWGEYQPMVYEYLKGTGLSPQEQIGKLEQTAARAAADGQRVPPGFNAQLGLLYLKAGQPEQARVAFRAEEAQFPESRTYMEFLLAKLDQPQGGN